MILGIDASNIRVGGGLIHLKEFISSVDVENSQIKRVVVWSSEKTLNEIEERPWLKKCSEPVMEKSYLHRSLWQYKKLSVKLVDEKCDILFVPGGVYITKFRPVVTMSQNLIPFELKELFRYGISLLTLKFMLLRIFQSFSFKRANGTIFLTENAKKSVLKVTKSLDGENMVIPHGIEKKFFLAPRPQSLINKFSFETPFQLLYVSSIEPYKHHDKVIDAVIKLYKKGFPLSLKLIGSGISSELKKINKKINDVDPDRKIIKFIGFVPHYELPSHYQSSSIFLFASSCENMPITLLEAMASGVPIVCSDFSPMQEMLEDAGEYFDPENSDSIAQAIQKLIESPKLRAEKAKIAFELSQKYSWTKCITESISFLSKIFEDYKDITAKELTSPPLAEVAIIGPYPPPFGGTSVHIRRLLPHLNLHGIHWKVYNTSSLIEEPERIKSVWRNRTIWFCRFLLTGREPIVFLHGTSWIVLVAITWLVYVRKKQVILTIHNTLEGVLGGNNLRKAFVKYGLRSATEIIAVNETIEAALIENGVNQDHVSVINAYIEPQWGNPGENLSKEILEFCKNHNPLILSSGGAVLMDGQDVYGLNISIDLVKKLTDLYPDIGLLWFLLKPLHRNIKFESLVRQRVTKESILSHVLFVPESKYMYNVYALADVVLRLTTTDGDSVTVREAHAAGVPTLVSNASDRPEECYVAPLKLSALESSLKNILDDLPMAQARIKGKLSTRGGEKVIIDVLNKLLSKKQCKFS